MAEGGPLPVAPRATAGEPPAERLTTGSSVVDEALGGGVLRGSLVAVVGPEDGLASKMMVLTAVELARRGNKALYHHHKAVPTFLKFAERLGIQWRRPGLEWLYHPAVEHRSPEWGYRAAIAVAGRGADIHFADQYELVASTVGPRLLADEVEIYLSTAERPVTTVLIFNSPEVWRQVEGTVGSAFDYVFRFEHGSMTATAPDADEPLRFAYRVDWEGMRIRWSRQ